MSGTHLGRRSVPFGARHPRARVALLLCVVVMVLAACTDGGSTGGGPNAPQQLTSTNPARPDPTTTAAASTPTTTRPFDSSPGKGVKVAWINEGAARYETWTAAHAEAARAVDTAFGDKVDVSFVENVAPGADEAALIDRLVEEGNVLILATSLAMSGEMEAAARRYPDVRFEQARGYTVTPNLSTFTGAYEQSAYLVGMAGAAASKTHRIGFVAQFPQPELRRIVSAYTLGARSVDPRTQVSVAWVDSWYDPTKEKSLALGLVGSGADVVATTTTGPTGGEIPERCNVAWSGHDADWSDRFPEAWLTASITDWKPYYTRRVGELLDGRWVAGVYYGSLADGFIHLAPFGTRVTSKVRARITERQQEIENGTFDVFAGPLVDNRGRTRVSGGSTMTVAQRLDMDWLAEGVHEVESTADYQAAC